MDSMWLVCCQQAYFVCVLCPPLFRILPHTQDGVLCFCRLSLALGGVLAAGGGTSLQDLLSLVTRDINAPAFTW